MKDTLASPQRSLMLGGILGLAVLALWLIVEGVELNGLTSFVWRWLHVVAAMIWIGLIWFVNFIQLVAIGEAEPAERGVILKRIVPRVAWTFRQASHVVVASGAVLLATNGYLLDRLVFTAPVYMPPFRVTLLWLGTIAALAMYAFAHMMIWPGLRIVLGLEPADADKVALARAKVATYARWNLILSVPVTVAMVAVAHLY